MNDETKYTIPFLVLVLLVTPVMAFAQNTEDSTTEQQNPHLPDGDVGPVGNADERINKLGNNGVKIHKQLQIETDPEKIKTLTVEFENIKEELRTYGVPTVEEYEENKLYWRQIAAEYHLGEGKDATISNVYYVYSDCCDQPGEVRFQSGYSYDCFYGLWTCHAYAPNWENLSDGQSGSQTLHIGNSHDWLDPFWLMKANKRLNATYTFSHVIENDGGSIVRNVVDGDVQYFPSRTSLRIVDMERYDDPRQNFTIENTWMINSIR